MGADIQVLREDDTLGMMLDPFIPAPAADCRHAIELNPMEDMLNKTKNNHKDAGNTISKFIQFVFRNLYNRETNTAAFDVFQQMSTKLSFPFLNSIISANHVKDGKF